MTRRRRRHVSLLLFLAVLGVACTILADTENECLFYDPPPIVLPSQATLLPDTVDIRMGPDTLLVALWGYKPPPSIADNMWLSVVPSQSEPPTSRNFRVYPEPSTDGLFAVYEWGEPPAGEYHIAFLEIGLLESSCTMAGESWIYGESTPSDIGMTDSVFVILSNFRAAIPARGTLTAGRSCCAAERRAINRASEWSARCTGVEANRSTESTARSAVPLRSALW